MAWEGSSPVRPRSNNIDICDQSHSAMFKSHIAMLLTHHDAGGICLFVCMIRRSHEWARFYMAKAHLQRFLLHEGKLVGRVVARHRQMVFRRAQILPDGEDVCPDCCEIAIDL